MTPGPWAADVTRERSAVVTTSGALIATVVRHEDARHIAEARSGIERAIAERTQAEADRDAAKVAGELAANAQRAAMADLDRRLEAALADRDRHAARATSATERGNELAAKLTSAELELAKLRPLADAVERWIRYRYAPGLLAAWEAFTKG